MPQAHTPWWRGERGEWYVVLQLALLLLVVFGPSTLPGYPQWPGSTRLWRISGATLMVCGVVLGAVALRPLVVHILPEQDALAERARQAGFLLRGRGGCGDDGQSNDADNDSAHHAHCHLALLPMAERRTVVEGQQEQRQHSNAWQDDRADPFQLPGDVFEHLEQEQEVPFGA